jgi:hypothetical protein
MRMYGVGDLEDKPALRVEDVSRECEFWFRQISFCRTLIEISVAATVLLPIMSGGIGLRLLLWLPRGIFF